MTALSALSSLQVPFGLREGRLLEPLQVESGLRCECVCPGCGTSLIARHSPSGKIRSNFAHASDSGCSGGLESAIHLAAKQLIADRHELYLPELVAAISSPGKYQQDIQRSSVVRHGELAHLNTVRLEEMVGAIRPDIIVETFGQEILVEIANTHFISPEKLEHIRRQMAPTIEVDVSDLEFLNFEELANRLFQASPHATWAYHPELAERELQLQTLLAVDLEKDRLKWESAQTKEAQKLEDRRERTAQRERQRQEVKHQHEEARTQRIAAAIARPQQEKLEKALELLGREGSDMNTFLPIHVRGASSIHAPPLIWQIVTFAGVVHPALMLGKPKLSADQVRTWIGERFEADTSSSSMAVAVWDFLSGLAELGILHKARRQEFLIAVPDVIGALEVAADAQENGVRELVWGKTWPSPTMADAVADVFATIYGHQSYWDQLAGLFEVVKRWETPAVTMAQYQRCTQGAMKAVALRRYFLSAGFARLPETCR